MAVLRNGRKGANKMNNVPLLFTAYCVLTDITQEDMPVLRQIMDDEQFQRYLPELYDLVKTPIGLEQFIHVTNLYRQKNDGFLWGMRIDGTLIGFIAIIDISYEPTLFYATHPSFRNQGYTRVSVMEVINYFQKNYPNKHLHTELSEENTPSKILLAHCGFTHSRKIGKKIHLIL